MTTYSMAQADLCLLLPLRWQYHNDHQQAFGRYKKTKYTVTLGMEASARVEAAMKLPSVQARGAMPEKTRLELQQQTEEFVDMWNLLDGYIEEVFPAAGDYKASREAAGAKLYTAALNNDWGAAHDMVNQALAFVDANSGYLIPPPGSIYTVTISGEGFQEQTLTDVVVEVGVKKRVDVGVTSTDALYVNFMYTGKITALK